MSAIERLTPHMSAYSKEFADTGRINWMPYLMYFHPADFQSDVVSTDSYGFRFSQAKGLRYSAAKPITGRAVRLLVGSSTVFGIGASADRHTLASRMSQHDSREALWVNFGGRSFNSAQELILFLLHRHLLPEIKEIVFFSGFNDLGLARLPKSLRRLHGAFFNCQDFYSVLCPGQALEARSSWISRLGRSEDGDSVLGIAEQIDYAVRQTQRNLDIWRLLAAERRIPVTFVLQPLAGWIRPIGCKEEEQIFAELEKKGRFAESYGDILEPENYRRYSSQLHGAVESLGIRYIDMASVLARAAAADKWLFVDRIHFTDHGHDCVAQTLLAELKGDS